MRLLTARSFDKDYAKLSEKVKQKFKQRRNLFLENEFHPLLNNHPLSGEFEGCWSFNVTGDWRAIYFWRDDDTIVFLKIGTHSELYG